MRLMHHPAVKRRHRLQFHRVAPAPDFFGGVLGLLHQGLARLGAVAAHVHHHLGRVGILLKEQAVGDVLQVGKRLALTANEPAGVVRLHVEQNAFLQFVFLDRGGEAEGRREFFPGFLSVARAWDGCGLRVEVEQSVCLPLFFLF